MRRGISVVHVAPNLQPSAGGLSRVVVQMTDALARTSCCKIWLLSQGISNGCIITSRENVDSHICETNSTIALGFGLPLRAQLIRTTQQHLPSVIHNHGIWQPANHWAARIAQHNAIPMVIQPHGMLEARAMQHKPWKKRLALSLYQRRDLETASVFIASAEMEFESIRKQGLKQPVALIPNGIEEDVLSSPTSVKLRENSRERIMLFLSRVHSIKGLLNLVRAWGKLKPAGWRLQIAGPDENGHLTDVLSLITEVGIRDSVDYLGEVEGPAKKNVYNNADVFVLPTFSENFGVVVAEALAYGLPVITTKGAPWQDLINYKCGWWIDIGVDPLVEAIREATSISDLERSAMGERGRVYVQRYNWLTIANHMTEVYRWIVGQATRPETVRTE